MRLRMISGNDKPHMKVTVLPDSSPIAQMFIADPAVSRVVVQRSGREDIFEREEG